MLGGRYGTERSCRKISAAITRSICGCDKRIGWQRRTARGLARGEARGRIMTEDRNNRLFEYLLRDGRLEEAKISTENPAVKEKLY